MRGRAACCSQDDEGRPSGWTRREEKFHISQLRPSGMIPVDPFSCTAARRAARYCAAPVVATGTCAGERRLRLPHRERPPRSSPCAYRGDFCISRPDCEIVDKAFPGANSVVAEFGLCEASAEQAWLKDCISRRAAQIIVLADADKPGRAPATLDAYRARLALDHLVGGGSSASGAIRGNGTRYRRDGSRR